MKQLGYDKAVYNKDTAKSTFIQVKESPQRYGGFRIDDPDTRTHSERPAVSSQQIHYRK